MKPPVIDPYLADVDAIAGPAQVGRATAARLYAERGARNRAFGSMGRVFREPAWDIALDLFVASEEGRVVCVSSAAIASRTPMTTGLRCIDAMVECGMIRRRNDPQDARRSIIALTTAGSKAMVSFLRGFAPAQPAFASSDDPASLPSDELRRVDQLVHDA